MGFPKTDLTGRKIGKLSVIEYVGRGKWKCKCECGKYKNIDTGKLVNNIITSCGHDKSHSTKFIDITNQRFGDWVVLEYKGRQKWLCQCQCSKKTIRIVDGRTLRNGLSTGCGHTREQLEYDLTGLDFGDWHVIKYVGNQNYLCKCSCGKEQVKNGRELRRGNSRSCGHNKQNYFIKSMTEKYGEVSSRRAHNPRENFQIEALESRESLLNFINTFYNHKPTSYELSNDLNIIDNWVLKYIHKYGLEDFVDLNPNKSHYENELENFVRSIIDTDKVILRDTKVLNGKELDIYIPDKNIAIEFNGTYWHSSKFKSIDYHVNKTRMCAKQNIRLIQIFEYEWANNGKQEQIKKLLKHIICKDNNRIYARDTIVKEIKEIDTISFLDANHLQGYRKAKIAYGMYYENKLIGVMTFSKPRFDHKYQYEIIRLAWDPEYNVVGGAEKLYSCFVREYKPVSVISYCDLSKFSGAVYLRLGFKVDHISKPNYVWVSGHNTEVLNRYSTMKRDLIAKGFGDNSMTEDQIMENRGYLKIYDCGNAVFTWGDSI